MNRSKGVLESVLRVSRTLILMLAMGAGMLCLSCATPRTTDRLQKKAEAEAVLGITLAQQNKMRAGLAHLLEAARLAPDNPRILNEVAIIYRELKQYDLSEEYFNRAIELRPDFAEAWNNLGTIYLLKKAYKKAISCFNRAVSILTYKTPHFAFNNLGLAYYGLGSYQKAIENYKKALSLAPDYSLCWLNLGLAYEATGKLGNAKEAFQKAIKYAPEFAEAHLYLGRIYLQEKNPVKAEFELKKAIRLAPETPIADEGKKLLEKTK